METMYSTTRDSVSSLSSNYSDYSDQSRSTALTIYSRSQQPGTAPSSPWVPQHKRQQPSQHEYIDEEDDRESIASDLTYASTVPSLHEPEDEYPVPVNQDLEYHPYRELVSFPPSPLASSPSNFASYFPSNRRLRIAHAPGLDGNLNLTLTTAARACDPEDPERTMTTVPMALFHLRMRNLKSRDFSLRRYCRDSGREVCHSTRRHMSPPVAAATAAEAKRPGLQGSMSSAFTQFRFSRTSNKDAAAQKEPKSRFGRGSRGGIKRVDSGYASAGSSHKQEKGSPKPGPESHAGVVGSTEPASSRGSGLTLPTNTTKLEFSNYTHLDLHRRGARNASKRYEFEYWGTHYAWRRVVRKHGPAPNVQPGASGKRAPEHSSKDAETVEFHLHEAPRSSWRPGQRSSQQQQQQQQQSASSSQALAHIVPEQLSVQNAEAERVAGSWVPPASLWISDDSLLAQPNAADVADVVVATGLMALVDDCIKSRWDHYPDQASSLLGWHWPKSLARLPSMHLTRKNAVEQGARRNS